MPKYVAMAFHPWTHLQASTRLAIGNLPPVPVRARVGMGIGFLVVYGSRVEAETANPGIEILEIEEAPGTISNKAEGCLAQGRGNR